MRERRLVSNLEYWSNRLGEDYRHQQDMRRAANSPSYALQEAWLVDFVKSLHAERKGARLRVLDYGCGFGRFAYILSALDFVDYFGFDFSEPMTAPLLADPPAGITEVVRERVRISKHLEDVFPAVETFDLIFTVSVLIHNQPTAARAMLSTMMDRLAPDGKLVLIENPFTAVSMMENLHHGGCWCHVFPRYFEGRADVEIIDMFADRHGIYIASLIGQERPARFRYRERPDVPDVTMDLPSLLLRGLERAEKISEQMLGDLTVALQGGGKLVGQLRDVEENLASTQRELSTKRFAREAPLEERIESQGRQIEQLTGALSEVTARFVDRQKMLVGLGEVINASKRSKSYTVALSSGDESEFSIKEISSYAKNMPQDIRYSWNVPDLTGIVHLFHAEWFGIRAAVGSLPGDKIAISAYKPQSSQDIIDIYSDIAQGSYKKIIIHGYSLNMSKIVSYLSRMGMAHELYVVKHGNPAQWSYDQERRAAFEVLELVNSGRVRRAHFMKAGFEISVSNIFRPMLFNMSPVIEISRRPMQEREGSKIAFAPGWADWRKNLYTSLMAGCMSNSVDKIWIYANNVEIPSVIVNKVVHHKFINREQTFDLINNSSICMNASVVDCHPMVNVESQTLGKACIRGNLHLDALEDHPYVKLTEVDNVMSIADIKDTIDRVFAVPREELRAITLDYQASSDAIARGRYLEFLEL